MNGCAFGRMHPWTLLLYLGSVIVFVLLVRDPICLGASFVLSSTAYLTIRGLEGWKVVCAALAIIPVIAVFNGLVNTMGSTLLATYLGSRRFTLESLSYGAATGVQFAAAIVWFGCFNRVMTQDNLTCVFVGVAPAITLTMTMVMRFVPWYQRKTQEIGQARRGLIGQSGNARQRLSESISVLSSLTTWALEESVVTADSMRSRGYGCAKRTSYAKRIFGRPDFATIALIVFLDVCIAVALISGSLDIEFFPVIEFAEPTRLSVVGIIAYITLCAMPSAINAWEVAKWRASLSRI